MIHVTAAGYAPPTSTHSRALDRFRRELIGTAPDVEVEIEWNVLDRGLAASDLLHMVGSGAVTICYFSTSYLVEKVPELAVIDVPFRFADLGDAHAALDGDVGALLSERTEAATPFRVFGYWDNGFRHLTNRLRTVRDPGDCAGMRVRVQPSRIHERMIELLGAIPVPTDLQRGIELIRSGGVDAQENPLANTIAYGIGPLHRFATLTQHAYGARGLYAHAPTIDRWPDETVAAVVSALRSAIAWQRDAAASEETSHLAQLESDGVEVLALEPDEREAFRRAVEPLHDEIRRSLPDELFGGA